MKQILIDGNNLLNSPALADFSQLDFDDRREQVLRRIETFAAGDGYRALVVFDNRSRPAHRKTLSEFLLVEFAPPNQEADDVLRRMIREAPDPASLTLVTSDRAIRLTAREYGVTVIASDAFAQIIDVKPDTEAPPPPTVDKYNTDLDDDEVQFWKDLFDRDGQDG